MDRYSMEELIQLGQGRAGPGRAAGVRGGGTQTSNWPGSPGGLWLRPRWGRGDWNSGMQDECGFRSELPGRVWCGMEVPGPGPGLCGGGGLPLPSGAGPGLPSPMGSSELARSPQIGVSEAVGGSLVWTRRPLPAVPGPVWFAGRCCRPTKAPRGTAWAPVTLCARRPAPHPLCASVSHPSDAGIAQDSLPRFCVG